MEIEREENGNASPVPENRSDPEKNEVETPPEEEKTQEASAEPEKAGDTAARPKLYRRATLWVLLAVIVALAVWFTGTHVFAGNQAIRKDAESVDLRGQSVTVEAYEKLTEKLPEAEIRWDVPLSTGGQDSGSETLRLSALTEEDIERLSLFPSLKAVELAEEFSDYSRALLLKHVRPDLDVSWSVELGGKRWYSDARSLKMDVAAAPAEELTEKLAYLPEVESLTLTGGPADYELLEALDRARPGLAVSADVDLFGTEVSTKAEELSFAGRTDLTAEDLAFLKDHARWFPALRSVDLTDCGLEDADLVALASDLDADVIWTTQVYGVPVCSTDTQVDLSYLKLGDGGAKIEALVPGMHHLEKVVMLECGIPDEDMDQLNKRHENVKFVWMVHFGGYQMRSDETAFIAAKWEKGYLFNSTAAPLKYCTDLVALDMGHQRFTDISFLYNMPHLRFLILADGPVYDITPVASLKELEYLEIFKTPVVDLSPLLECKNLKDLNISYLPWAASEYNFDVLMQLPSLERLFFFGNRLTQAQKDALRDHYPDAEIMLYEGLESTGLDWRYHERYYEMRDMLDIYYMPGGTNGEDNG